MDKHGNAHWSLEPALSTHVLSVTKSKVVECTEYLIERVYIKVGNNVYRQTIGLRMGTNCAPQLAHFSPISLEYLYMKNLMHDNLGVVKQFSDAIRYIDDLLTLNNGNFEQKISNIYPPERLRELVSQIPNCPT